MSTTPNPGSPEAIKLGCACPVLDNNHGRGITWGYGGSPEYPAFWISSDCAIHASFEMPAPSDAVELAEGRGADTHGASAPLN